MYVCLKARLRTADFFIRNKEIETEIVRFLKKVKDVPQVLLRIKKVPFGKLRSCPISEADYFRFEHETFRFKHPFGIGLL